MAVTSFEEVARAHPGPQTIEAVRAAWAPRKVAEHFILNGCSLGYLAQSVALVTMSLLAVGASGQQCMEHVEAITNACRRRSLHVERERWGSA